MLVSKASYEMLLIQFDSSSGDVIMILHLVSRKEKINRCCTGANNFLYIGNQITTSSYVFLSTWKFIQIKENLKSKVTYMFAIA